MQSTAERIQVIRDSRATLAELDDNTVVASYLSGNTYEKELAIYELVNRYQSRLFNFVYRLTGDREKAEDIIQEVFVRMWKHLHRFNLTKKFSTWIYIIASNLAKNEVRDRFRRQTLTFSQMRPIWDEEVQVGKEYQFVDPRANANKKAEGHHIMAIIEQALTRIPLHQRNIFVLREIEGRPYDEIAQIIGCSLGTVKSRLFRGRLAVATYVAPRL